MWQRMLHTLIFEMILFNSDLDNTIIYSYKHDIGTCKKCAEIYEGREISFITDRTYELLKEVSKTVLMIPTTTRTTEQYNRIDLQIGAFPYALTCNGGVLLVDGQEDEEWYKESLEMVAVCQEVMNKANALMEKDPYRNFELRYIKELFLYTKSSEPEKTIEWLRGQLDLNQVDVFNNGVKVYVVPKDLNKGRAIMRLKEKLGGELVIAAGDSEFDISMVECADYGIAPQKLPCKEREGGNITKISEQELFSEKVLERVLEIAKSR